VQPERIVERLWPGRASRIEPLGGGITNRNFRVDLDGEQVVLRIGGKDTEALGIDRRAEHAASVAAAGLGVAPEVVAFVEPEGYLVTRYVPGAPVAADRLRDRDMIGGLARIFRRIHNSSVVPSRFDPFRVVEAYRATAAAHGHSSLPAYDRAKPIADMIERLIPPHPEVFCHNDLLNANFIDDGTSVRIVDWEYAGMGDRYFDLGNLSVNNGFAESDDERLLAAYFGPTDPEPCTPRRFAALRLMRIMSDFREGMWGVVQTAISALDFDFAGYADEHLQRVAAGLADERFATWLEDARGDRS
jgi:thiamine kinase-like enzyme